MTNSFVNDSYLGPRYHQYPTHDLSENITEASQIVGIRDRFAVIPTLFQKGWHLTYFFFTLGLLKFILIF